MNTIITIARQYGSGGHEVGRRLAASCGVKCFDKDLITLAAQKSGINSDVLENADETASSSLLYTLAMGSALVYSSTTPMNVPVNDRLFVAQSEVIKELATEPCVIVGRCADYVLSECKNLLRVYIYADLDDRVREIIRRNGVTEKEARDQVTKMDRRRANYYNYYTGEKWGKTDNYDLALSTSKLSLDGAAAVIAECAAMMDKDRS